jgi:phosphoribosyl-AMP cyclohydrolase
MKAVAAEPLLATVTFDEAGLVPVIAQEASTGMVRMFAWANRDALAATLASGAAHFWSRSRKASGR